jgi:hypothetical protein
LDGVFYVAKVSAGLAGYTDLNGLAVLDLLDPFRDHGGIGSIGVPTGTEDVEIAKSDRSETIGG